MHGGMRCVGMIAVNFAFLSACTNWQFEPIFESAMQRLIDRIRAIIGEWYFRTGCWYGAAG